MMMKDNVFMHNRYNLYNLKAISELCEKLCKIVKEDHPEMVDNLVLAKYDGLDVVFSENKLNIVVPMPDLFNTDWSEAAEPLLDMINKNIKFWELKEENETCNM